MMSGSMERPELRVEGPNDMHALVHLLIQHGIDYDHRPWPAEYPEVVAVADTSGAQGVEALLDGMELTIQRSVGRPIGFVLDADSPLRDRWAAVSRRLTNLGVNVPPAPPPDGFRCAVEAFRTRVGVWLMPDNVHDGTLETFLRTLITEGDPLITHAETSTNQARDLGAEFGDVDQPKAIIHTWLAWQPEPGLPYGTAIRAQFFRHRSPAATAFVAWFKELYGIP
jgi:hypothetical protein